MDFRDQVKALVGKVLETTPALFLTDLKMSADNAITMVIDGDNGVGTDNRIALSRTVGAPLDAEGADFSLEVTSFGATEPFVLPRRHARNVGRTVQITTTDGKMQEGVLKDEVDGVVTLEVETREPKPVGKGRITMKKEHSFALPDIKEAKVIIKS